MTLSVTDLRISFHGTPAVDIGPTSFSVSAGSTAFLMGPSGCGKSTILRAIMGLLKGVTGCSVGGEVVCAEEIPEGVSIVFQRTVTLPHLSVIDNVLLPYFNGSHIPRMARDHAVDLLTRLGLESKMRLSPSVLSGGMQTRVALARALITGPKLILLDEPFAGLDVGFREVVYELLESYRDKSGAALLMVTHDLEEAWRLSDRVFVLNASGRLVDDVHSPRKGEFPSFRRRIVDAMVDE